MPLSAGDRLDHFEILAPIGAGGMGEVYKARDTRINRLVAIKVVNERFSGRFEREARAISGLNHPHICTLYDVGPVYLVMELVEGESLAVRLEKGRFPPGAGAPLRCADRRCAGGGAREGHHPSRPVAWQPHGNKIRDQGA